MKKNIIYIVLLALVTSISFSSCEDMLTPDMDRNDEIDAVAADTLYSYWGILKSLQSVAERYVVLGECRGDLVSGTEYVSDSIHAILDFQTPARPPPTVPAATSRPATSTTSSIPATPTWPSATPFAGRAPTAAS